MQALKDRHVRAQPKIRGDTQHASHPEVCLPDRLDWFPQEIYAQSSAYKAQIEAKKKARVSAVLAETLIACGG